MTSSGGFLPILWEKKKAGGGSQAPQLLPQGPIPALLSVWIPSHLARQGVQLQETKSQSCLGAQPGGGFCFNCRLWDWHCLPFLLPLLSCLDLGIFESCSAPQLFTLQAHKCFNMTWEPRSPDEWKGTGTWLPSQTKSILNLSSSRHQTYVSCTWLWGTQDIRALGHH